MVDPGPEGPGRGLFQSWMQFPFKIFYCTNLWGTGSSLNTRAAVNPTFSSLSAWFSTYPPSFEKFGIFNPEKY